MSNSLSVVCCDTGNKIIRFEIFIIDGLKAMWDVRQKSSVSQKIMPRPSDTSNWAMICLSNSSSVSVSKI